MINEIWSYFKNPTYTRYTGLKLQEKAIIFYKILILAVSSSFILGLAMGGVTSLLKIDLGAHSVDEMLAKYSIFLVFLLGVIIAPVVEELLFRAPLALFKKSTYFKFAFYASVLIFGAVHLSNFELFTEYLWLAPLLVAPQISAGIFLGFIRVKLGLRWSFLLHAGHNAILFLPLLLVTLFGETATS
ncbi:CPBP family intramembrane glutamic endopeptidase [Cellulophaga sp. Hel_I_12]|uniref:CPBP family intramembrane glutamic endopeptidase n=1 Tax=Cellulophaga sp. Hel_I_12 TaxID=1249972 RepID=UPI00068A4B70|nr:CPBP family intramembrane glutamic endopeptidase [Cellulophaga sp. Hel_I_12]